MGDDHLGRRGNVPIRWRTRPSTPTLSLTRRHLLAAGLGIGGSGLVAGAVRRPAQGKDAMPEATHEGHLEEAPGGVVGGPYPWEPADLVKPEVRPSSAGALNTTLRVGYAYQDIGGYRLNLRTYEGAIPGRHSACAPVTRYAST